MKRRDFLKGAVVAGVSAPVVAKAVVVDESELPLVRISTIKDDIGYMEGIHRADIKILLDGVEVGNDVMVQTIDEPNGLIIGWNYADGKYVTPRVFHGNYRIPGLTREQREAHIDSVGNRVRLDEIDRDAIAEYKRRAEFPDEFQQAIKRLKLHNI